MFQFFARYYDTTSDKKMRLKAAFFLSLVVDYFIAFFILIE